MSLIDNVKSFNFGNITINIDKYEIEENINQFKVTEKLLRYKFITPWIALNRSTGGEYRFSSDQEKPLFLNKLLGQNLLFISKELGEEIKKKYIQKLSLIIILLKKLMIMVGEHLLENLKQILYYLAILV